MTITILLVSDTVRVPRDRRRMTTVHCRKPGTSAAALRRCPAPARDANGVGIEHTITRAAAARGPGGHDSEFYEREWGAGRSRRRGADEKRQKSVTAGFSPRLSMRHHGRVCVVDRKRGWLTPLTGADRAVQGNFGHQADPHDSTSRLMHGQDLNTMPRDVDAWAISRSPRTLPV
jgi:hypothetical protein